MYFFLGIGSLQQILISSTELENPVYCVVQFTVIHEL